MFKRFFSNTFFLRNNETLDSTMKLELIVARARERQAVVSQVSVQRVKNLQEQPVESSQKLGELFDEDNDAKNSMSKAG